MTSAARQTADFSRDRFETEAVRLRPFLHRVAMTILGDGDDAEDAVQESLLKLWHFRRKLVGYDTIDAPATIIVRRVCLNMIRTDRRRRENLSAAALDAIDDNENTDSGLSDEMTDAIEALPTTEQCVLRMKHLDGLEIEEIAAMTGSTPGAIRTALSRARKKVRDAFINRTTLSI